MIVLGITGPICGGKSTVCRFIREAGAVHLDCDATGHDIYLPGQPAYSKLVQVFGQDILSSDATIDRKALGRLVFGVSKDKLEARQKLNEITWPIIAEQVRSFCSREAQKGTSVVAVEAAGMIEAGWISGDQHIVDVLWVAYVPRSVSCSRLMARNSLTFDQAEARIKSQMELSFYLKHASRSFNTDKPLDELRCEVQVALLKFERSIR